MSKDLAVEVNDLKKTYKDGLIRKRKVEALKGVSLEVEKGEVFGLLGPNGAGKTTLIKILLGIVHNDGGSAKLLGVDIRKRKARIPVGYLPEHHRIPRHHTANSAMEYYGALCGVSTGEVKKKRDDLYELVGIAGWGKSPVRKFSKGMQQRLGIALAMIHDPEILILDEPTDGVDPVGRRELRDTFQNLKERGKTIFLNSHLLQETELVCDRVAILNKGLMKQLASVRELKRKADSNVILDIKGKPGTIFTPAEMLETTELADDMTRLHLNLKDQEAVDKAVDKLREAKLSIVSLKPLEQSLEDAFIEIVRDEEVDQ